MSYLLFIDESGHDRKNSPYEVLSGVAIEDKLLWNIIQEIQRLEKECFGMRITKGEQLELKGKKLLKNKTFKHANQLEPIDPAERTALAKSNLEKGKKNIQPTKKELTALGQAKIAFVKKILYLCKENDVKAFASIVDPATERPPKDGSWLHKDYSYLFERFFYFLEDQNGGKEDEKAIGIIVFDELEKSRCHLLLNQMEEYFLRTEKGVPRRTVSEAGNGQCFFPQFRQRPQSSPAFSTGS